MVKSSKNRFSIPNKSLNFEKGIPSKKSGVYAFWWKGKRNALLDKKIILKPKHSLKINGISVSKVEVNFNKEWLEAATVKDKGICLYIGKSTDIRNRVTQHLKLNTNNIWTKEITKCSGKKPNSSSQLRIGLERIFDKKIHEIIRDIGITYIELNNYENGINRFFIEDKAIGHYFPLLNVDIER